MLCKVQFIQQECPNSSTTFSAERFASKIHNYVDASYNPSLDLKPVKYKLNRNQHFSSRSMASMYGVSKLLVKLKGESKH